MAEKEYIEREAVLALAEDYEEVIDDGADEIFFEYIPVDKVRSIPAADVRPVVLCKDCKYWEYDAIFVDGWCRGKHQGKPNWFCADGEKREES